MRAPDAMIVSTCRRGEVEKEPLVSPFEHSQQDLPRRTLPPEAGMKIPAELLDLLQGWQVVTRLRIRGHAGREVSFGQRQGH